MIQGSKAGFRDTLEGVTLIIPNSGEIAEAEECWHSQCCVEHGMG